MGTTTTNLEYKQNILNRLNRIEGQVKGIHKMVESDKQCGDILTQISAVRAAITKVGALIVEEYSKECMLNIPNYEENEKELKDLLSTISKFLNFTD